MAYTPLVPQAVKNWTISIGNSDAQNWKLLKDDTVTTPVGPGATGAKLVALWGTSTDSSARNIQIALVRSGSVSVTSATPAVVTWTGNTLAIGDQIFFTAATIPTGVTATLPYWVISAGFTAGSTFEFAASAGGAAINTSSTGTTVVCYAVRILTTIPVAITSGTDGSTATTNFLNPTYWPGLPVDNDGNPFFFLESVDYLAVASASTVTSNKIINVSGVGANF